MNVEVLVSYERFSAISPTLSFFSEYEHDALSIERVKDFMIHADATVREDRCLWIALQTNCIQDITNVSEDFNDKFDALQRRLEENQFYS